MKLTLLEMVKDVLSSIESDEVDTITETPESEQVLDIIKSAYFTLMSEKDWQHQRKGLIVAPFGTAKPTHVKLPDNIKEVVFINYDKRRTISGDHAYSSVKFIHTDDFLRITNSRKSSASNVSVVQDFSGTKFMIRTDTPPTYFTSFDDKYIVFDSYNTEVEDTIMSSKIQAEAYFTPEWVDEDDFIPDMPASMFPMLVTTAKRQAFINAKQTDNPLYAQQETRNRASMSAKGWNVADKREKFGYGRRSQK